MEVAFPELAGSVRAELDLLASELAEIELLVGQTRSEAERHESRRSEAEAKLGAAEAGGADAAAVAELGRALAAQTRRAVGMAGQLDVLDGKRALVVRARDGLARILPALEELAAVDPGGTGPAPAAARASTPATDGPATRVAQEELRREISRAMHDGPAQSLTNIVLEAEIVERLLERDPAAARAEMERLKAMVGATLDATKRFIFDVRPMVLDDLGLVPTLRRAARDRGRAAGIPVAFDSLGPDRRLPRDLESAVFRILDEALVAWLALGPTDVTIRLDWGELLDARVGAGVPAGGGVDLGLPGEVAAEARALAATVGAECSLLEEETVLRIRVAIPDAR